MLPFTYLEVPKGSILHPVLFHMLQGMENNFLYHFWLNFCTSYSIPNGKINTENMLEGCFSLYIYIHKYSITQKCAIVFTSIVFSTSESGDSIKLLPVTIPALLTRMLTSPTSFLTYNKMSWDYYAITIKHAFQILYVRI